MKTTAAMSLLIALFMTSCQNNTRDDPETLKMVLLDYYDGIKNADHEKMRSATTNDFLIYEAGEIMNNDSVFKEMDRISPYQAEFKFEHFKIKVDHTLGHMSYHEHATFVVHDTVKVKLHFTGSAAFTKIGSAWKMCFMHATPVDSLILTKSMK
jgi:hypothetical protein